MYLEKTCFCDFLYKIMDIRQSCIDPTFFTCKTTSILSFIQPSLYPPDGACLCGTCQVKVTAVVYQS